MPLSAWTCTNCGHWQRWFAAPPQCPVCVDVRNALPSDGWEFRAFDDLAVGREARWEEVTPGVTGFWCEPQVGLGTCGWVIETGPPGGGTSLVGWEAAGLYPPAAIEELRRRGGLAALASSHVHGYGALFQLQDELDPPVVAIGVRDLEWTKAFRVTWPLDDRHEFAPGLVAHRTGGHFDGHMVLHDERRGILFCGDMLKASFDADGRPVGLSAHKAFHAQIPLSHQEIRDAYAVIERLDFEAVATPFEYAAGISTKQVIALYDRLLSAQPLAGPIPLEELS
ncbi:MBL fold metallo-hydrolase [Actinomycetospora cinnamomea]|uniref:Metallo-beta-lactamase superfamily protein n=1 Tax=Actinomycetospora cinnamomea TaxID=663609 RepID=A0A2U1FCP7_9PSEU|nr:MBL fold metallo-hydrolase [Actinomycetospora cinnamomea]PVZ09936.1 metallo-beta-lactamase superfamily protein [Actinomycetospora cinnamomea]